MRNTYTMTMNQVVAITAKEAGISENELYAVKIIGVENGLCEMVLETEWNTIQCYTDMATGEVLGILAEPKSPEEILFARAA